MRSSTSVATSRSARTSASCCAPPWLSAAGTWAPTEPRSSAAEMPCRASCWCGSDQIV